MWSEWFKFDNFKWLLQTAAIPVTLAYLSQGYQNAQTARQANEGRVRLYTELLSKREEADTGVRRGIFDKVFEKYLDPQAKNLDDKLVALELLALNFNDSLDLSPLFWQLDRQIQQSEQRVKLQGQLERIANAVKDRQIETLKAVGSVAEATVSFAELANSGPAIERALSYSDPDPITAADKKVSQLFRVEILEHQPALKRIQVRVYWNGGDAVFWVDLFDFPMTNFVPISKSERLAAVLKRYSQDDAQLSLIYFPRARSGIKDKPFIDEVISDLRRKSD